MADSVVRRALKAERLYEVFDGVYSLIPPSLMQFEHHRAAAILAGGDGAVLCAQSAAHHADLAARPSEIHVAVKGARGEAEGVRWHRLTLAEEDRIKFRGMPITRLERIPLDLAATTSLRELKRILAELEYRHDIGPEAIELQRGRRGSARLRRAVHQHTPQLAQTLSELERTFIHFLDHRGFALPRCNQRVDLATVDAVFAAQKVVVELDGVRGHAGARRILRDHRRDLHRRADGFAVLRYAYAQILEDGDLIDAELERHGVPRLASFA